MNPAFPPAPDVLLGDFFRDVQLSGLFSDSKTFVDSVPNRPVAEVLARYEAEKNSPDFDLERFVRSQFTVPEKVASGFVSDTASTTTDHINRLWEVLTRPADEPVADGPPPDGTPPDGTPLGSSRVPLPHPYVVPGGRFREIFYWDSYFTMLGLRQSGRLDLIRGMLDNFATLIERFGFIPNGNRTYFLSRSQPPFFALMVQLLAEVDGPEVLARYLPPLRREYDFWMSGEEELDSENPVIRRVVRVPGGVLNRYWDDTPTPRPEAYRQEIELTESARALGIAPETLYEHIRAACESGWDFSSRWLADEQTLATIRTATLVPVDLNGLLYSLETTLRDAYAQQGQTEEADAFGRLAEKRKALIQELFWNSTEGFFSDYDLETGQPSIARTLAGAVPLFFNLATPEQGGRVHEVLRQDFLQVGGWVTTLRQTGQQWDWPNGWAPLQWLVFKGLTNYGFTETAEEGRRRWLELNDRVFRVTGKLMEKYNVVTADLTAGGGEYPNQDGFGWTNGVYLALSAR